ncbi:uncharacterized protein LOC129290571 [Prosopis cineraria]|uniref:uncharacterized protein LOC129290571 n=1 Tax=Prosopis cineraria TaxID=364024 RepID=UPI00240F2905|nr:uncharacterized protein LOC129290571 [Prosopis cineraria]
MCAVGFQCGNGSAPPPPRPLVGLNISDPCRINICWPEGSCEREGSDHKCQCSDGSDNLLGNPKLPCFKKCSLGADCNGLGLGFNQPPPSPPPPTKSDSPTNGDMVNELGKLYMPSVIVLAALVLIN